MAFKARSLPLPPPPVLFTPEKTRSKSISEFMECCKTSLSLVDWMQEGSRFKSIQKDLKQEGVSNVFSEASRRAIKDMGNIELYELGETVRPTQCPTCLRRSTEETVYCVCGKCLMPSPEQTERIKNPIDIIADLVYVVKRGVRGVRHGPENWQYHHWKAKDAPKTTRKEGTQPSGRDGKKTHHIEKLNRYMDELSSSTAFSWTASKTTTRSLATF